MLVDGAQRRLGKRPLGPQVGIRHSPHDASRVGCAARDARHEAPPRDQRRSGLLRVSRTRGARHAPDSGVDRPLGHLKSARNPVKNLHRGRPLFAHHRGGTTLDLAFIDGMHLFEYALRDFINVERFADWSSVIVFDDMLPRNVDEAARDRHTTLGRETCTRSCPCCKRPARPDRHTGRHPADRYGCRLRCRCGEHRAR